MLIVEHISEQPYMLSAKGHHSRRVRKPAESSDLPSAMREVARIDAPLNAIRQVAPGEKTTNCREVMD